MKNFPLYIWQNLFYVLPEKLHQNLGQGDALLHNADWQVVPLDQQQEHLGQGDALLHRADQQEVLLQYLGQADALLLSADQQEVLLEQL